MPDPVCSHGDVAVHDDCDTEETGSTDCVPASEEEIAARDKLLDDAVASGCLTQEEANIIRSSPVYSTSSPIASMLFGIIDIAIQSEANLSITRNEMSILGFDLSMEGNDDRFYASVASLAFTVAGAAAAGAFACTRGVKGKGGDGDPKKPVPGAPSPAGGNRNGSTSVDGTFDESSFTTFGMNVIFQLFGDGGNVLSAWFTHEGEDKNAQVEVLRNGQQNQNDLISSTYIMQWL